MLLQFVTDDIAVIGSMSTFLGLLVVLYWIAYSRRDNIVELKVVLLMMCACSFMVIATTVGVIVFNQDFLALAVIAICGVSFLYYSARYTAKTIASQRNDIERHSMQLNKVIKTSSESAVDILNIATELATSITQVNSSAETISTTTMEVATRAQN